MKIIGLCGQSGAGKTTALRFFREKGFQTVDCDLVAREVTRRGEKCLDELVEAFGEEILNEDGELDRRALAAVAFSNEASCKRLNEITHAHILKRLEGYLSRAESEGYPAIVLDAPTLFESGLDARCDVTLALIADREVRLERVMRRDGISRDMAEARLARQISENELAARADHTVRNDTGVDALGLGIEGFIERIGLNK